MIANYHVHTARCRHARGTDREYVEAAIAAGLKTIGFADHSPYWFEGEGDYYSIHRMFPEQTADYINSLHALREEYRGRIEIWIGFEAEYYEKRFDLLMEKLDAFDYDYLILGQHYVGDELEDRISMNMTGAHDWEQYVDQCVAAIQTGRFTYVAHPDCLRYSGDDAAFYRKHALRLCEAAKAWDLPLEINLQGLRENRRYPREDFWEAAREVGNTVVFGWDAHSPNVFNDPATLARAAAWVEKFQLPYLDTLTLRNPKTAPLA
jgi:histidinol-phosphatase (PHP family)